MTIFFFSGTGNARRIAFWFSEFAAARCISCELYDIAECDKKNLHKIGNSLVIIISPTHGFNFPKITMDFIRKFPKGRNKVVLMNTRAGMKIGKFITPGLTGIALILSSIILKIKGYKIAGQIPFDMPSNWISLHPALNEKSVKYLHKINYERAEKYSERIFSGQNVFPAYRDLIQDILISPVALAYFFIGRFAFAKSFYASAACDSCGLCSRQCPVSAIKMIDNRPFWTLKCESCMKCMNSCPKRAIDTAHALIVLVSILSSIALSVLMQNVLHIVVKSSPVRIIAGSVIFITLLCIFYYLQHLLLKNRKLSRIISFTSLTYYKFWGRYKSIPDNKWRK